MSSRSVLENVKFAGTLGRPGLRHRPRPVPRTRPGIEPLEGRSLLSTFTVVNTNDSGAGSLRDAITRVNADTQPGIDTINFAIAGAGVHTIIPLSGLPKITHAVVIDGTTQPGFAGNPLIELDGASAARQVNGGTVQANGLTIDSGGSTIKDLVINRFGHGIVLETKGGNTLSGNYIGTDASGTRALGNNGDGVWSGTAANTIGGTTAADRNLISGNAMMGVALWGQSAYNPYGGNLVEGNYIGTDVTGTHALGNGLIHGNGGDGVFVASNSNTIGGTTPGARNLISGNYANGVDIAFAMGRHSGNVVEGNFIGTDASGTQALGNLNGVLMTNPYRGPSNIVGGTASGAGNLISGNTVAGVSISDVTAHVGFNGALVEGNLIGTDASGTQALGNAWGVYLATTNLATIGGTTSGAGNIIAFNTTGGVYAFTGTGNAIRQNSIFSNGGPGIVAGGTAPVLTSAVSSIGFTAIEGTLTAAANTTFILEFFSNPSGSSQGKTYLGLVTVTTDATGRVTFKATFGATVAAGQVITATATDASGSSSAFSSGIVLV
jgi:hypothetical protein